MCFAWRAGVPGSTHSAARLYTFMKTIVIGLGNPILGDDGVGWKVAEEVQKQLSFPLPPSPFPVGKGRRRRGEGDQVDIDFLSLGGISLMEHLIGYERAILIDAVMSEREIGSVVVSKLDDMPDCAAFHTTSAHDMSLQTALKLGKAMGASLPKDVTVVGIAASHIHDFSEELSPAVARVVPKAAGLIITLLA